MEEQRTEQTDVTLRDTASPLAKMLSGDLREKYEALMSLADKSPIVNVKDMGAWDANQDFIVFYDRNGNGHFDIQRGFALKAMRVFEFGKRNTRTTTTVMPDGVVLVNTILEVYEIGNPVRYTEVQGGCSTEETRSKGKSGNTRAYHDAVAIAETRALKRGVEELAGMPIVNALIRDIFGGFDIKARELRDVTPKGAGGSGDKDRRTEPDDEIKSLIDKMGKWLSGAKKTGVITVKEFDDWKRRVLENIDNKGVLKNLCGQIEGLIQERTDGAS
jgi:hypothetical protein